MTIRTPAGGAFFATALVATPPAAVVSAALIAEASVPINSAATHDFRCILLSLVN
jgi:hypothetical protein